MADIRSGGGAGAGSARKEESGRRESGNDGGKVGPRCHHSPSPRSLLMANPALGLGGLWPRCCFKDSAVDVRPRVLPERRRVEVESPVMIEGGVA